MSDRAITPRALKLVGEFGIIVLGVMIALAGDGWIQDRQDSARVRSAVELLVTDLVADSIRLGALGRSQPRHEVVRATIWATPIDADVPQDSIIDLFQSLLVTGDYAPSRSTFESLMATDGLRHLGDAELRSALVTYYQELQADVVWWLELTLPHYERSSDLMYSHQQPATSSVEEGARGALSIPVQIPGGWAAVRGDAEFMSQLLKLQWYQQITVSKVRLAIEANVDLRARLSELR